MFSSETWKPYIKGAEGREWVEPLTWLIRWVQNGLDIKIAEVNGKQAARPQNEEFFFRKGIAITTAGSKAGARMHRYPGIFGDKGRSLFPDDVEAVLCLINSSASRRDLSDFNPTIDFTVGDINRLCIRQIGGSSEIVKVLDDAFQNSEAHREGSVEFKFPGPSPWRYAQDWAQQAVDRPEESVLLSTSKNSTPSPQPIT